MYKKIKAWLNRIQNKKAAPKTYTVASLEDVPAWLDRVLAAESTSEGYAAFCFNLYEDSDAYKWSMEIIGTEKFDLDDSDWPCYEMDDLGTRISPFVWQQKATWEEILAEVSAVLKRYLKEGQYSNILKAYNGVGVGFVSGDLEILWTKEK